MQVYRAVCGDDSLHVPMGGHHPAPVQVRSVKRSRSSRRTAGRRPATHPSTPWPRAGPTYEIHLPADARVDAVYGKRVRRVSRELGFAAASGANDEQQPLTLAAPNLAADLTSTCPNHVWVADINCVRVRTQSVSLAVLPDAFRGGTWGGRSTGRAPSRRKTGRCDGHAVIYSDQGMPDATTRSVSWQIDRPVVGERVHRTAQADFPRGGGRARRVRRFRRRRAAVGSVPGRRVRPQADPLVARCPPAGFGKQWPAEPAALPTGQ